MSPVRRVARIVLNSVDVDALAAFYVQVLGFERVDGRCIAGLVVLRLGGVRVDLREVRAPLGPRSIDVPGWSPRFQHFAIVVADMDRAMAALERSSTWTPITRGGPQRLPLNTGGVTAFKFRDPEGHPLELLRLPDEATSDALFVRIDHSAISVADVERSIAFYERLGLEVADRSLNRGVEQEKLDGIDDAVVDVVSLHLPSGTAPHLELLGYRGDHDRSREPPSDVDDPLATRLVFDSESEAEPDGPQRDPDGHVIEVIRASR